jgi:hypothetical protein
MSKLDWHYFPFVKVHITDLIDDERNLPMLLKRCSHPAQRSGFVRRAAVIQFNHEVLAAPNWTLQWCAALHWFDCY